MSCLIALPPQVQPLMAILCGGMHWRSNHPPETRYTPTPSTQILYREFLVVTSTRSPARRSFFCNTSSDRACVTLVASVCAMAVNSVPRRHVAPSQSARQLSAMLDGIWLHSRYEPQLGNSFHCLWSTHEEIRALDASLQSSAPLKAR